MESILSKEKCTGCTACMNSCPKKAISMIENFEGFKYPVIDQDKCIDCGLCKRICPVLNTSVNESLEECYVAYAKEEKIKEKSSSGGLFSVLANKILADNGLVVGAAFDEDNKLKHIAITKKDDLEKLKGSKYLQSDLENIFIFVKDNIESKKILFAGTPCQVAGLKSFLKKDFDNLICIDLFCHGVPSPRLFEKYIKELEAKQKDKIVNYNFRDKSTGWDSYSNTVVFKNSIKTELQKDNDYMKLFLNNVALRDSCYQCNFKLGNKYSDITLGDFWGVKKYYPEMYNTNGVSAIIVNTAKGKEIFDSIKENIMYKNCKIFEIIDNNPCLRESVKRPKRRNNFFKDLNKYSINQLEKKYVLVSLSTRIKKILKLKNEK